MIDIDKQEAEEGKIMAIFAYIIFLIPLFAASDNQFARYHTNQGVVLFLAWLVLTPGRLAFSLGTNRISATVNGKNSATGCTTGRACIAAARRLDEVGTRDRRVLAPPHGGIGVRRRERRR